jgi:hypothetical protein
MKVAVSSTVAPMECGRNESDQKDKQEGWKQVRSVGTIGTVRS